MTEREIPACRLPAYVVAVDPGKTSGLAVVRPVLTPGEDWRTAPLTLVRSDELLWEELGAVIRDEVQAATAHDLRQYPLAPVVVAESFVITPATARNSQAPWSLQVLGMLDWLVFDGSGGTMTVARQAPSSVKPLVPNPRLKALGLWHRGGGGHANDALRHAVYAFARAGWYG